MFHLMNYSVITIYFRCDRYLTTMSVSRDGGVILALKNIFEATRQMFQILRAMSPCQIQCKILTKVSSLTINELLSFKYLKSQYCRHGKILYLNIVLVGDFHINNFCNLFSLIQYNSILNNEQRLLDLVFPLSLHSFEGSLTTSREILSSGSKYLLDNLRFQKSLFPS